jgi:hypothetical protein
MTPLRPNLYFDALVDEHRRWLSTFDPQYLANWENVIKDNEESGLAEAGVRRLLQGQGIRVEPNEDLTVAEKRCDFRCESNGSVFEAEVTHISIEKATKMTGLTENPIQMSFGNYSSLNDAIFAACMRKEEKCKNARHPTLLVAATFHAHVPSICFIKPLVGMLLTGQTNLAWDLTSDMDQQTFQKVGEFYETTDLRSAAFVRPDKSQEVGFARNSISELVLCGLRPLWRDVHGVWGQLSIGVLHPNPDQTFNPANLPGVEFGEVAIDWESRQLCVSWPKESDE